MAANKFATMLHENNTPKIAILLIYTLLEWTLISLLLSNAFFSFLIAKFAHFFGLKPSCLFCSRVDHLLGTPIPCTDLICDLHSKEIFKLGCSSMSEDCASPRPSEMTTAVLSWMKRGGAGEKDLRCACCGVVSEYAQKARSEEGDENGDDEESFVVENCDTSGKMVEGNDASLRLMAMESSLLEMEERMIPIELIDSSTLINRNVPNLEDDYVGYNFAEKDNTAVDIEAISEEEEEIRLFETMEISNSQKFTMNIIEDYSSSEHQFVEPELIATNSEKKSDARGVGIPEPESYGESKGEILIQSEICDHDQIDLPQFNEPAISQIVMVDKEKVTDVEPVKETIARDVNGGVSTLAELTEAEEERLPETPTSIESFHAVHKRFMFERRETGTESLDGSVCSEIDGSETLTIDHLKSVLKAKHKVLSSLYMELEEERSASAIAANQTMAMITRLQEEKAAMQMEALQYQRMMEEQSEYDQEALQLPNELMVQRDKEKQELEKELEACRKKLIAYESTRSRTNGNGCGKSYASSSGDDSDFDSCEGKGCNYRHYENNSNTLVDDVLSSVADHEASAKHQLTLDEGLAEFETERLSILEQLNALEGKLISMEDDDDDDGLKSVRNNHFLDENVGLSVHVFSGSEHDLDTNGKICRKAGRADSRGKRLLPLFDATTDLESEVGRMIQSENNRQTTNGSLKSVSKPSIDDHKRLVIAEEVNNIYERLEALEEDKIFLEHCIRSLNKGDKGIDVL